MMVTKPDITKRQEQLLEELKKCDDELSGQELHRQLIIDGKSMGLTTVYRNLQVLIKHGLIRSRHLPTGEVLYTPVDRDIHHLTCVQCGETSKMEGCPVKDIHSPKKNQKNFNFCFIHLNISAFAKTVIKLKVRI
jgi:Fur family ferric uptake transcriptional regulator